MPFNLFHVRYSSFSVLLRSIPPLGFIFFLFDCRSGAKEHRAIAAPFKARVSQKKRHAEVVDLSLPVLFLVVALRLIFTTLYALCILFMQQDQVDTAT